MVPDLQASVLCDDVRQERNGKFILIGIFDVVGVAQVPTVFQRVCVVNRWCCGSGTFHQQCRLLKPDGTTPLVEGKQIEIKLPNDLATATSVEVFLNIKFEETGTHWVEILLDGDLKMRYPLNVTQARKQQGPQPPAQ